MEIIVAEKAGYCFGIENAMKMVQDTVASGEKEIFTLGPISHNHQETGRLEKQGVRIIDDEALAKIETGSIILRSHGVSKKIIEVVNAKKGLRLINATCPFVRAVQRKVETYHRDDWQILIVGDKLHPEVIAANGWCDNKALIINHINQLENIEKYDKICIVAQTTIIEARFNEICEAVRSKANEIVIFNTICSATAERQAAAAKIAKEVEYMIVIGGYHSSNTQKLVDVCKSHCEKTCHIETIRDLDLAEVMSHRKIGITAGASTPDWVVKEVLEEMEEQNKVAEEEVVEEVVVAEEVTPSEVPEVVAEAQEEQSVVAEEVTPSEAPEIVAEAQEEQPVVAEEVTPSETPEVVAEAQEEQPVVDEDDDENFDFVAGIEKSLKTIRRNDEIEGEVIHIAEDEVILNIGYKADGVIKKSDFTWKSDESLPDLVTLGDKIWCVVVELNEGSGNVRLSKIKYDNHIVQRKLTDAYEKRTILDGTVKAISGKGVIVDIGFTDIYMPASQYNTRYVKDLEGLIGEKVRGIVLDYNAKRRRAILSQKVILEKEENERRRVQTEKKEQRFSELSIDEVVTGVVKTITGFGIFVDLNGIDGFVHRSDLAWERFGEPKDIIEKGQQIEAKVTGKNEEDKKIKLSVKALIPRPWDGFIAEHKVGDEVDVTITNILDFGAFAQIIPGVEGLIHVSEISYSHIESVESVLSVGEKLTVKIIAINLEKEKISLSKKAMEEPPVRTEPPKRSNKSHASSGDRERGGNFGGERRRKPQQNIVSNNRNKTVYEEAANVTLGDSFGNLFDGLFEDTEE